MSEPTLLEDLEDQAIAAERRGLDFLASRLRAHATRLREEMERQRRELKSCDGFGATFQQQKHNAVLAALTRINGGAR